MSYQKPVILLSDDLAEGVYAASGASESGSSSSASGSGITFVETSSTWWSDDNGQVTFQGTLPSDLKRTGNVEVVITFTGTVVSAWGGGGQWAISGNTATCTTWQPGTDFSFTFQGAKNALPIVSAVAKDL